MTNNIKSFLCIQSGINIFIWPNIPPKIVTAIMKLYKNTKAIVRLRNEDTHFFNISLECC